MRLLGIGTGTLWHHTDFLKLWIGQTISLFGSRFTALAMQFIAAVTLQATPVEMGILAAVGTAPSLLVGLFAGVWVDRHRRRSVLIATDLVRALLLATIPVAALAGALSMAQLYLISFLVGTVAVFFDVAYQSYLPTLVDRTQLVEGHSKLVVSSSTANIAGLSVAGVVIQAITALLAIALDSVSYVASAFLMFLIRRREEVSAEIHAPMIAQVREGVGVVFGNPLLRAFALCMATSNFTSSIFFALYILFGTRELGLGAAALGLVYGVNSTSLRQAITPLVLQGRMNATMGFVVAGVLPLGGLAGGVLGQLLGLREAIVLAAVGSLLSFLWVLGSPVRDLERIPEMSES